MPMPIDGNATESYFGYMRRVAPPLLCMLGLFVSNLLANSAYIWPLKLTPELTSKFCDFRSGHFHGGLDIRTQGKTGFRAYAIDDGYIYRAVTSFRGYGRAVYLKMRDGKVAVYGHISAFTKHVEDRIFASQMKTRKYAQDLYFTPREFPVRKGDVIAFTGESGAGAPHLHFEIRSPDNNPINPLLAGLKIKDNGRPVFNTLAIKYFQRGYLPNGSLENYDQFEIFTAKGGADEYAIADTIICDGQMALAVSGGDRIAGPGFLYGFYGLRFYLDDSLMFEMRSDSLAFSSTGQLNYVRDSDFIGLFDFKSNTDNDANIFYRLYAPPFSRQFFWPARMINGGIIEPSAKAGDIRKARIVAFDETGNETTLKFLVREPELELLNPEEIRCCRDGNNIYFIFNTLNLPKFKFVEYRNSPVEEFQPLRATLTVSTVLRANQEHYIDSIWATLPAAQRVYRLRYEDGGGRTSPWLYFREGDNSSRLQIGGCPELMRVEYQSESIKSQPIILVRNDYTEFTEVMRAGGPGLYLAEFRNRNLAGQLWIGIESADSLVFDTTVILQAAAPHHAAIVISPDSTLRIQFVQSSAYYPAYIFPSKARREVTTFGPGIVYDIRPTNMLVDSPIKFVFDTGHLGPMGPKAGVYGTSGSQGWSFISKIDGTRLEANGIGLGKIAILDDDVPPSINAIKPSGNTASATPLLSCLIKDNLSGLALNDGLSMAVDGSWVPAEFDVDTGRFVYRVKNSLKRGKHQLEIKASDNQGNSATKQSFFTVTGRAQ